MPRTHLRRVNSTQSRPRPAPPGASPVLRHGDHARLHPALVTSRSRSYDTTCKPSPRSHRRGLGPIPGPRTGSGRSYASRVGTLEVRQHEDVEELGAWSRAEPPGAPIRSVVMPVRRRLPSRVQACRSEAGGRARQQEPTGPGTRWSARPSLAWGSFGRRGQHLRLDLVKERGDHVVQDAAPPRRSATIEVSLSQMTRRRTSPAPLVRRPGIDGARPTVQRGLPSADPVPCS